jgi:hypothetical protein
MNKELAFNEKEYTKYLTDWLDGIVSELAYWNGFIESNVSRPSDMWENIISNNRSFEFDEYVNSEKTVFLDVGSGPFSAIGTNTAKTNLEFHAVDPLAFIYNGLKKKNNIDTGTIPEFAFVEKLTEKFGINKFDIVHMSNALDHAFNPVIGIYQMLTICKINGKVILQHYENEAEIEKYEGFHQWNLCIENHDFFIWRPGTKINVTQSIKEYADSIVFYSEGNKTEGKMADANKQDRRPFKVILTKKQNLPEVINVYGEGGYFIPKQNSMANKLEERIFERLSESIMRDFFKTEDGIKNRIKKTKKKAKEKIVENYKKCTYIINRIKRYGLVKSYRYYTNKYFHRKKST